MNDLERGLDSKYNPSHYVWSVMQQQRIVGRSETPQGFLQRVVNTLFSVESQFGIEPSSVDGLREDFAHLMVEGYVMPGTPTLTNAGRNTEAALSSCVVIPVDLRDKNEAAARIKSYYRQNMGSGFDFTEYDDPVGLLKWVNDLSVQETATGAYDRYIGNMGSLHVSHPRIDEFIDAKAGKDVIRHFNISVDVPEAFMLAVHSGQPFVRADGVIIDANALLAKMAQNAWRTGDPGVLFLDRMNRDNPVEAFGRYISTPPCGEMGLALGETCQFGYINLARFGTAEQFDYNTLGSVVDLTTRVLDNAIEYGMGNYPTEVSNRMAALKRKIGIGVCGLADLLIGSNLSYGSDKSLAFARDVLSFINFRSKVASVDLAKQRGACLAMVDTADNRYYHGFLEDKYAASSTTTVSKKDWEDLSRTIARTGMLLE